MFLTVTDKEIEYTDEQLMRVYSKIKRDELRKRASDIRRTQRKMIFRVYSLERSIKEMDIAARIYEREYNRLDQDLSNLPTMMTYIFGE